MAPRSAQHECAALRAKHPSPEVISMLRVLRDVGLGDPRCVRVSSDARPSHCTISAPSCNFFLLHSEASILPISIGPSSSNLLTGTYRLLLRLCSISRRI